MLRGIFVFLLVAVLLGCQSGAPANSNTATNVNTTQVPPEFSGSPIEPGPESTPGIPPFKAVNALPKGATPTPGIPDPKLANKMIKPGATPTPGIPDPETIRRQMRGLPNSNVNARPEGDNMMRPMKKGVKTPQP